MSTAPHDYTPPPQPQPASGSQPVPLTNTVFPATPVQPNVMFGQYQLLEQLGEGGMGVVHRAWDTKLARHVALKRLKSGTAPDLQQRFVQEGQAAAQLDNRNLCRVYAAGEIDGTPFIAMEYVQGKTLRDWRANRTLAPREAVELVRTLAVAIGTAHAKGVVHRDLKPGNVVMRGDDDPVVIDFGLAKQLECDNNLTNTGQVLGTPKYMPPEQSLNALSAGAPADVWALGVVLFELVAGKPPFDGVSHAEIAIKTATEEPDLSKLGTELAGIVANCLQKEPGARYANGTALAAALRAYLDAPAASPFELPDDATEPDAPARPREAQVARRRWVPVALASAAVLAVCALVVALVSANRDRKPNGGDGKQPIPIPDEPFVTLDAGAGTTFRFGNWEYLIDATPFGARRWLDEHQKAKRTVMWLDAYQFGERVRFAALATNAVSIEWNAVLDVACSGARAPQIVADLKMDKDYEFVSVSLYNDPGLKGAFLWHRGKKPYLWQVDLPGGNLKMAADRQLESGSAVGFARPLDARSWAYAFVPPKSKGKSDYLSTTDAREVDAFFENLQKNHGPTCRPVMIAAGGPEDNRTYGATAYTEADVTGSRYKVGATEAELREFAAACARDGFVPASLTGYSTKGGSRFCAVWVKRGPKPVAKLDPKLGTVFAAPGWEYLIDATPTGIDQWLKDRRDAGHSVMWLDAYMVGDKSRFAALAAHAPRDASAKDWIAKTDTPFAQFNVNQDRGIKGLVPAKARLVSLSVYQEQGKLVASLWHPGTGTFQVWPAEDEKNIKRQTDDAIQSGALIPQIRPYTDGQKVDEQKLYWSWFKINPGAKCLCISDGFEADANKFIEQNRKPGFRPGAIGGVSHGGRMHYGVTMHSDESCETFDFETRITADELRDKVQHFAKEGYEPASLTGYDTTTGTRFAVVWVKRAPAKK